MDFGFSEEQEMLRDAAKRFLADNCSTKFVRQMMADESAHDAGFWRKLVDLGWPGLLIPEEYGGQGGTFLDMTVIAEEAGKALVPGPFFAAALLGAPIVIEGGSDAQKKELLPKMAKGEYIATVAIAEAAGRFDAGGIELKAGQEGRRLYALGEKFFVPDAHVADCIVVAARSTGSGEDGVTLLMVPAKQKGVTVTQLKTVDMTRRLCHVKFDGVTVWATVTRQGGCADGRSCAARWISQPPPCRPRWSAPRRRRSISRSTTRRRACSSANRSDRSRRSSTSAST